MRDEVELEDEDEDEEMRTSRESGTNRAKPPFSTRLDFQEPGHREPGLRVGGLEGWRAGGP